VHKFKRNCVELHRGDERVVCARQGGTQVSKNQGVACEENGAHRPRPGRSGARRPADEHARVSKRFGWVGGKGSETRLVDALGVEVCARAVSV
jgi:hypothetical protein